MTRTLSLTWIAVFLIGMGSSAALAKPTIAVLGLEVVDPNGAPTAADTQVAKDLTEGLRLRAKAGTGPYQLAPASDKELIDQKLLNNCDSEAPACMSVIGNQLGADFLLFGNVKKVDKDKSYQISIKLLDVSRKTTKSTTETIPVGEASGTSASGWAKKIYSKLTGDSGASAAGSTLVVKLTNADRGTILINGEERGNITNGSGTVTGLESKTYHVAVESEGFRRYEKDVTIGSKSETVSVELEKGGEIIGNGPGGGPSGPENKGGGGSKTGVLWTSMIIGGATVVLGGGIYGLYGYAKYKSEVDDQCSHGAGPKGNSCTPTAGPWTQADLDASNERIAKYETMSNRGWVIFGVGGGIALIGIVGKTFIEKHPSKEHAAQRGKRVRKERTFVVTPVMSPNGGGASLRFDW